MSDTLSQHPWLSQLDNDTLLNISKQINEFELQEQKVVDWFSNFANEEQYILALKIFFLIDYRTNKKSIDMIRIYKTQINQSMHKLNRENIILISSDRNDDSSNRFIYDIAKNWEISESNIFRKSELKEDTITNNKNFFVFFNDTHGTGNQFINEFKDTIDSIKEENCAILSITMTDIAKKRFKKDLPNIALVQPNFQSTKDIFKHQDNQKLNSTDINLLKELGENIYSKGILGYKDTGLLVAYSHQCPNNTLPIIWANGDNNKVLNDKDGYPWNPLFEYKKIKEIKKKEEPSTVVQEVIRKQETVKLDERLLTSEPTRNIEFVGRVDEIKEIKENLVANNLIYIVNGIGGVGKSELSYEYFHQYKNNYKKTAFIELSDDITLEEAFIIKFKEKFQLDTFDAIIRRLQEFPERNLFLIDNLERIEDFKKLKPLNTKFDLLITTRSKAIDTKYQLNLNTLTPEDAKKLFLSIYNEDENIKDILVYLDNHPLFINLTAKSLEKGFTSLEELRDDIKYNRISKINSKEAQTFQEHLHKRFNNQFENEKDEELKILLQKLAIFPSIEIDLDVFTKLLDIKKSKLQMLVDRGWLSQKENKYKLHQIIKTFILEEHQLNYSDITHIFKILSTYIDPDDSTLIANKLNNYIPIIESFLNLYEKQDDNYIGDILDSLTYLHYSLAQYDKSLEMQQKSSNIRVKLFGEYAEITTKNYNLLGVIYSAKGNYDKALYFYEKSLEIKEKLLGNSHIDTAMNYNNLATVYMKKGDDDKAVSLFEKTIKIIENILGRNHYSISFAYNNLASAYLEKGDDDKALSFYKKSLKIVEEVLGNNHPSTAISYNNLGSVYTNKKNYDKALFFYEKSLKIREKTLGNNHPDTATCYYCLAILHSNKKNYNESISLYNKTLYISKEVLGNNHPDTVMVYCNLGYTYLNMKDCTKSKEYLLEAKNILEKLDYKKGELSDVNKALKQISKNEKLEAKAKRKGRFCKEYKILEGGE